MKVELPLRVAMRSRSMLYVSRKYLPFKIRSFIDFIFDPANIVRPRLPADD